MKEFLPLLTALLGLLSKTPTKGKQKRRNIRFVKKTYKQFKKDFKKDGLDDEEKAILKKLKLAIIEKTLNL